MTANINFQSAIFETSAPSLKECPADLGIEVAFAGRSNAGKSSAINTLTRQPKLARTSKTPGRTRLINFFSLNTAGARLVDLPGYGYAKVPKAMKAEWDRHLAEYLRSRKSLVGLVLLMDIRHPLQEFDRHMMEWAVDGELPVHLLLTKADKLKKGPAQASFLQVQKHLNDIGYKNVSVQTFSSLKKVGLPILEARLKDWFQVKPPN